MRLITIILSLLTATACASTPDLSTFKSQGEALIGHTEAAVSFYPALPRTGTSDTIIMPLRVVLDDYDLDAAAFCAIEVNKENDPRCDITEQPVTAVARYVEIAARSASYSQRVSDYAAAGKLGGDEANPVSDSLTTLLTFARASPLPGSTEAAINLLGEVADQVRQRRRNNTLLETIQIAQPSIDALAFSVWASLQYCDIRPSNRLLESLISSETYTRSDLDQQLASCPASLTQGRHASRTVAAWSRATRDASLLPASQYANYSDDQVRQRQRELVRLARIANQYLVIDDCAANDLTDTEQIQCAQFETPTTARNAIQQLETFQTQIARYNDAINTTHNDRLTRVRAGRRLVQAYLAWADGHSELPQVIAESQAFNAGSLFGSSEEE